MTTVHPEAPADTMVRRGLTMPTTRDAIREACVSHQAFLWFEAIQDSVMTPELEREDAEMTAFLDRLRAGEGEPEVFVHCFSDTGTGWEKRAVITSGVLLDGMHFEAHNPVVFHTRSRNGRLKAHEWVKREIWREDPAKSRLVVAKDVPVRWETDRRV